MAVLVSPAAAPRRLRHRMAGLAVLAVMAGASGPALAQLDDYGGGYARYGYDYDDDYGPRYDYAPRRAAPIPPRAVGRIAAQEFGLREVQRTVRTGSAIVVDGLAANGSRVRLIIDRFNGELIDRIVLQPPRVVRLDPREEERPAPKKLTPRPPERPAALKPAQPPAEASAPATVVPPSPAAPKPDVPTTKPAAVPSVAPSDIGKPKLVNPQDVRGAEEPDRLPPLARAHPSGIPTPDTTLPPVQIEEMKTAQPKPETPIAPVNPPN
ncbi:conserved exported hypothetical protein [Bosea sp. 62]|uniref:hypothetical protein n=1 Tax=unclassified Bosea (in: a-proteobacteria) TaxID=2653178 RepID=UPI0012592878|nr:MULTISPECIES: hypothetical protein [unclassified Bosea (in: a-proteobacteria)]CAD5252204.1 conserved exported hypothetical protein [Bosea sp. 7B]CAD5279357.1 conserved exported hypothetical protein [Bosea sp. 21B]CAD5280487.1 conserved exported hypothetical protein [Bosea sp. 46]VVT59551.1 conserved exported hypothetical protein [Bosea sp. EC-HK365B]VXB33677.1 conserved exported hypothetical protein [Bosea sp. 62]